jgi:hypothetical protein
VPSFRGEVNNGPPGAPAPATAAWYNPRMKECPLCGETMRLNVREIRDTIPGSNESAVRVAREWICPECDYFEEAEAGEG